MKSSTSEQTALITGGSRGIGAGIATKLAEMGLKTVILGRNREALRTTAEHITAKRGTCLAKVCNLEDQTEVEQVAREVESQTGAPDILVNCAGVALMGRQLLECTAADWDRVMNTNLRGVFFAIKAFAPAMVIARRGHIINISSIAGRNPLPGGAIYSASKWGLNGLSYSLAEELRIYNIRVSVVSPGSVSTDFSGHKGRNKEKMLTPADVAHAVAMLLTQAPQSFISEVILRPTQKP
ncbi:MAG TPA: SDR family oxidoreductase [Candidatus Saccharimonadales bacterium]|nr:SDR family oxidoreductase [Candidatus Saccharimonadales bacterium]